MESVPILNFRPFSLDGPDDGLWCGLEQCKLTAKAEAVLRYLVAHPGRLVRRGDLLAAVWPDVYVNEWVLTTCIREIRHVLGDVRDQGAPVHCDGASSRISFHRPGDEWGYASRMRGPPICAPGGHPGGGTQAGNPSVRGTGRVACPGGAAGPRALVSRAPDGGGANPGSATTLRGHPRPVDR